MKNFKCLTICCLFLITASVTTAAAFAGATQPGSGLSMDQLGRDLSIQLQIPLFDPDFSETPVASLGTTPILLKELTPSLTPSKKILFWDINTSAEDLSEQFKKALDDRIKQEQADPKQLVLYADEKIHEGPLLALAVPLFSNLFAETPVALINDVPVTVAEFSKDLQSVHNEVANNDAMSGAEENIQRLMQRMITVRLVEQEARNIGFDQTETFKKQATEFAEKTLLYAILNKQVEGLALDEAAVDKLYHQISLQGKFQSYRFKLEVDATAFRDALKTGGNFDNLIADAVAQGKAVKEEQQGYIKFKDLLSNIAVEANNIEVGGISQIFRKADGFLIFKLLDRKFVEDPQALEFAKQDVWKKQTATAGSKYVTEMIEAHAKFDEQAQESLDFNKIKGSNPDITLGEALQPLLKDHRALVRVDEGVPEVLTVADLAGKIKETYFHGTDIPLNAEETNKKNEEILQDALFRIVGTMEAKKLGLDKTTDYRLKVAEFERRTLFDIFMQKVVTPDVKFTEEEVKAYYDSHQKDYMTPAMFRIKSLPFYKEQDAQKAAEKLRNGSDFKWVSANTEGLVDIQNKDLLQFDRNILSLSSLPQSLQQRAAEAKRGVTLVYSEPNNFYYVLYFEDVFSPEPKPYEQVRKELLNIVYRERVKKSLDEWVEKLKEAYETKVFLVAENH